METASNLLGILKDRFRNHKDWHGNLTWEEVQSSLAKNPGALTALEKMENNGGEPELLEYDAEAQAFIFCDCSAESPSGRRSLCYDQAALQARKANPPVSSAQQVAQEMGIELLSEADYRKLQAKIAVDLKTSSWVQTPDNIRRLGGALFCDRRYDQVFTYHNGADSYYAARGFRGLIKVPKIK